MPGFTLSTALAVGSVAVGVAGTAIQARAMKKAEGRAKEANRIQRAGQQIQDRRTKRQAARQERIRRARLTSSATTAGVQRSSAQMGASGALTSNFANARAGLGQEGQFATAISNVLQQQASYTAKAKNAGAWSGTLQSGLQITNDLFD